MSYLIRFAVFVFWLLDVFNFSFMERFDTQYPMNFWFWLVVWILIPSATVAVRTIKIKEKD